MISLGVNILANRDEINWLLEPIGERLDEWLRPDRIIIKNLEDNKKFLEGSYLIQQINKELNAIGSPLLKVSVK